MKLSLKRKILAITFSVVVCGQFVNILSIQNQPDLVITQETFAQSEPSSSKNDYFMDNAEINPQESIEKKAYAATVDQNKVNSVRSYLSRRNSPLADYSEYLVRTADEFGIDYRLVAAISVIESGGCIHMYRPYNCWGWGGANGYSFSSFEDSIYTVTKGISTGYGNVSPLVMAPSYNPHTPHLWGPKVVNVMNQM